MKKILVVIDMQNDFITGSLGSKYAEEVVLPNVMEKLRKHGDYFIYTKDCHTENYLNTLEGQKLPVEHCILGTEGFDIASSLGLYYTSTGWRHKDIVYKNTFGSPVSLPSAIRKMLTRTEIKNSNFEIEIVGLCTDICVINNALILRAQFPDVKITCDSSCCGGTSKEAHDAALTVMRSCQIDVV